MKTNASSELLFYQTGKISITKSKNQWRKIFRTHELLLAENIIESSKGIKLLASNENGTVLAELNEQSSDSIAYSAYGHYFNQQDSNFLIRFNAEILNSVLLSYALGNGNRIYSPLRMRFNSPDDYSPFEEGGLNSYAYCFCDPVNFIDPSGNNPIRSFFKGIANTLGLRTKGATKAQSTESVTGELKNNLPKYSMRPAEQKQTIIPPEFEPDPQTMKRIEALENRAEELRAMGNRERLNNGELERIVKHKTIKPKHRGNADYYYRNAKSLEDKAKFIRDHLKVEKDLPPRYTE